MWMSTALLNDKLAGSHERVIVIGIQTEGQIIAKRASDIITQTNKMEWWNI